MNTFALHAGSSRATACAVVTDVGKRNSQSAVSSRRIASQGPDFVVTTTSGGSVDVPVAFLTYEDALLIESSRWSQVLNKLEQKGVPEDISAKSRDAESGEPHLAHAACCLLFLLWFERDGR